MAFKRVSSEEIFRYQGTDTETKVPVSRTNLDFPRYHRSHGLFYDAYSENRYGVVQIDGRFTAKDFNPDTFHISLGEFGYDLASDKHLIFGKAGYSNTGEVFQMNLDTLDWRSGKLEAWDEDGSTNPQPVVGMVKLSDRYLRAYNTVGNKLTVAYCPLDRSTGWTVEWQESPSLGISRHSWHVITPGPSAGLLWLCDYKGNAVLYDVSNKAPVGSLRHNFHAEPGTESHNYMSSYVPELGVFVVYRHNYGPAYIEVYVPEVEPHTLSDPVALDPLERGDASRVQVTLTGQHGEPITDYPIDWTLVYGDGALSAPQTLTDEEGKAEVQYRAFGPTSIQIQAEASY
jgi:hypothetical protein